MCLELFPFVFGDVSLLRNHIKKTKQSKYMARKTKALAYLDALIFKDS